MWGLASGRGCLLGKVWGWAVAMARLLRALGMLLLRWSTGWRAAAAARERRLPVVRQLRERMVGVGATRLQAPGKLQGMPPRARAGRLPALERLLVKGLKAQGMVM